MRFAALLLLLSTFPATAATEWTRLTTPHFELYTTSGEKKALEIILYFEQIRAFFTQAAPVRGGVTEFPVRIVVFKSEKQYKPYSMSSAAFAYYASTQNRDYIVMQDAETEHLPAAIHEYMHLIVSHSGLTLPLWMNEGWADVYSTLRPLGKETALGDLIPGRVQTLFDQKWMDFATLTSVTGDSPTYNEKDRAGIFYAESWALVHMLYLSPDYKPKFGAYITAILQGKSAAEACQTAYGRTSAQVFADLQAYLKRNQLFGARFAVALAKSEEEADVSSVSEFDSDLVLADLLATTRKREAAQSAYEHLAKLDPTRPEVPQSLGYLAWQHGEKDAARKYFEQAFAAGGADPQMCFHLAMLQREANAADDQVIPPLLRALKHRSDYLDARLQLAAVELNAHKYDAALAAFTQIHNVPAERAATMFNGMAYAYLQKGDLVEARKQAINARKWDRTEGDTRQTDDMIRFIDLSESRTERTVEAPFPPPSEAPILKRRETAPNPFVQPGEKVERVEGFAISLDCESKGALVRVRVGTNVLTFDMPDPDKIQLIHNSDSTFDFQCGAQQPFKVAVEYVPGAGSKNTLGSVRKIEF